MTDLPTLLVLRNLKAGGVSPAASMLAGVTGQLTAW